MLPNKQKQRFPATPEIAVSSLCGNKGIACRVSEPPSTDRMFPLMAVVTEFVTTTSGGWSPMGWTKFVHPALLTCHVESLLLMCGFGACGHKMSAPACYNISWQGGLMAEVRYWVSSAFVDTNAQNGLPA